MLEKIGVAILDAVQVIGTSFVIIVILNAFVLQPQMVRGVSMYPNLKSGDRLITEKVSYRYEEPQRGDIIVFRYPKNRELDYIKRIVGLPGERIQLKNNQVIIYNREYPEGKVLSERYLDDRVKTSGRAFMKEGEIIEIPENKYIVFGDNRDKSADSRQWGFVDESDIIGKAYVRYWPPNSLDIIQ